MILQNCIFFGKQECQKLYFNASDKVYLSENVTIIPEGCKVDTCTYINSFDIATWKKYTDLQKISFRINYVGKGRLTLVCERKDGVQHEIVRELSGQECIIELPAEFEYGLVYFTLTAWNEMQIYGAFFETKEDVKQTCSIALIICTYKRKEYLERTIEKLQAGIDFDVQSPWLNVFVIDNASELKNEYGDGIRIYHNRNTGGSGGFSRGMDEVVKKLFDFPATHVVLMDDDADVEVESFIRLKALVSYMKAEYKLEPVAGRMFRLDHPKVQYTALEIWNGGDIGHIGWNLDMANKDNLWSMNDNAGGEYGGWWFACYPIEFVKNNRPLPFFLHCDDVEYGLRHGGVPIILNGIQVWHETFEYRQTPLMAYYDTRNPLIVNKIYGMLPEVDIMISKWKEQISKWHLEKDYLSEYMIIRGMIDFLKGERWFCRHDPVKNHSNLLLYRQHWFLKVANACLWRVTVFLIKQDFMKLRKSTL